MEVKKYFSGVIGILLFLILIGGVSASFQVGSPSNDVETSYQVQEEIEGWINMSFTNQSINGVFTDNFGHSFSLQSLVSENSGFNYTLNGSVIDALAQPLSLTPMDLEVPNIAGNLSYQLNFSNQEVF